MDDYFSRKLIPFVSNIIADSDFFHKNNYLPIDALTQEQKEMFAAHLIESDDRDLYALYENIHYDNIISKLIVLLKEDSLDNRLDFAESVRDNIVRYYEKRMEKIIEDQIPFVQDSMDLFFNECA